MHSVNINRKELLDIVRGNKDKHIKEYAESVDEYTKAMLKIANLNLKLIKTGDLEKIKEVQSYPPRPNSYEDNYTRAARMLELSVDDVIELDEGTFSQLVLDEWNWKNQFVSSTTMYKTINSR